MYISQHDVATIATTDLKRLVVAFNAMADVPGPTGRFAAVVAYSLIRTIKERQTLELLAEAELMNTDDDGALVGPDDDPVADALRELGGESL